MHKRPIHWLVPLSLCAVVALPLSQAVAQTGDYTSLISQTTEALKNNNAEQAFQKALAAIAANPTGHEGYFYAGVAAYRQDLLDAAEKYVKQALERAPEGAKPLYQDTLKAIGEKKLFLAHVEAGQKAEEDGLFAKAAREYTTAWDAFPMRTEVGLKAAALWANRLKSPGEAARILTTILAQTTDEKVKQQAKDLLQPLADAVHQLYVDKLSEGEKALSQGLIEASLKSFNEAILLEPDTTDTYLYLARAYAKQNDTGATIKALTRVIKAGAMTSDEILSQPEFATLTTNADFVTWLGDAMGPDAVSQAKVIAEMAAQIAAPRQTKTNPKDGATMIFIPAGNFITGAKDDTETPRISRLDGYWIYKYEVTVGQYRKYCAATGAQMPSAPPWGWKDENPIGGITYVEATSYSNWAGGRLPQRAEWEKAARGVDGRTFPWGNVWDESAARCRLPYESGPSPVGSSPKGASPWGVFDMASNVWEWCGDYVNGKDDHPLCGGSWMDIPFNFRTDASNVGGGKARFENFGAYGFRCMVPEK